jgi:hypothetical protein
MKKRRFYEIFEGFMFGKAKMATLFASRLSSEASINWFSYLPEKAADNF